MEKRHLIKGMFLLTLYLTFSACSQKVEWVSTTESQPWSILEGLKTQSSSATADVVIDVSQTEQTIQGFGACFNELGWTSLNRLINEDRAKIFAELFSPNVGANFTICRMPVGANDFSRDWYSFDESEGDFEMKNFSIENDKETLIPFIKEVKNYNSNIKLWASPWSPPAWMKWNKHYACAVPPEGLAEQFRNHLPADKQGKEGTNMFIQEKEYFDAYALYFSKFIEAYKNEGIEIGMVMPQNEFNSCQIFPSCTWTAAGLAEFIGKYLGPAMEKLGVELFFGTMERPNKALVDTIMNDPDAGKFVKGVGFQWAGKEAIPGIHKRYPDLQLYQTEQECGNGKNDWEYCRYAWTLMKHYLDNGANAYLYWNISLDKGGFSRWGWQQNSLVTVDPETNSFQFNHEYYLLKHVSHFVQPGAKRIKTSGSFNNLLAFVNPDNSVVCVVQNETSAPAKINIEINEKMINPELPANSFNTFVVKS